MFQSQGNHFLKGTIIKEKNMLPTGRIFFPLRVVAPMRKENNFEW